MTFYRFTAEASLRLTELKSEVSTDTLTWVLNRAYENAQRRLGQNLGEIDRGDVDAAAGELVRPPSMIDLLSREPLGDEELRAIEDRDQNNTVARMRPPEYPEDWASKPSRKSFAAYRERAWFDAEHDRRRLLAEVQRLRRQSDAVRTLHRPYDHGGASGVVCWECNREGIENHVPYPCATIKALDEL